MALIAIASVSQNTSAQTKGFDVTYYDAHITLDRALDQIQGEVTMRATAQTDLSNILQHARFLNIDSVRLNGTLCSYRILDSSGEYFVVAATPIPNGQVFTLQTYYHGPGRSEGGTLSWGGVTDSTGMMFAMGVGFSAPYISCTRHWLPCYDLPDDKPDSVDMTFSVPDSEVVASNGLLVSVTPQNGRKLYHWHVAHPIASYLLTFATGVFQKLSIPNSLNIPFEVYAFAKDTALSTKEMTNYVAPALAFFDSLYGHYPFEKVGYVLAPFGSMEHQTMVTLDHSALNSSSTIAQHELSHQWWGDRVTCQTFDDAWLNEGFATFSESLIRERFTSKASYWSTQHSNIAGAISGGSTIALFGAPNHTSPRNNYPYAIIYQKGASVLGMLRYFLGDSLFFLGLREYGNKHAYSTATSNDLWHDFEASTKQDLGWFFKPWVFGIWYPQLKFSFRNFNGATQLRFEQSQDSTKYQYFRLPITVEARAAGKASERQIVWMDSTHFTNSSLTFSFVPDTLVVDPEGVLIKKVVSVSRLDVATRLHPLTNFQVRVDENPVQGGTLHYALLGKYPIGAIDLSVVNESGSTVMQIMHDTLRSSQLTSTVSISGLPAGSYFLVGNDERGNASVAKFIKLDR